MILVETRLNYQQGLRLDPSSSAWQLVWSDLIANVFGEYEPLKHNINVHDLGIRCIVHDSNSLHNWSNSAQFPSCSSSWPYSVSAQKTLWLCDKKEWGFAWVVTANQHKKCSYSCTAERKGDTSESSFQHCSCFQRWAGLEQFVCHRRSASFLVYKCSYNVVPLASAAEDCSENIVKSAADVVLISQSC